MTQLTTFGDALATKNATIFTPQLNAPLDMSIASSGHMAEQPQFCAECVHLIEKNSSSGFSISGDDIWDGKNWRQPSRSQMTVGGTGYCMAHGLEAYERTKQYIINE